MAKKTDSKQLEAQMLNLENQLKRAVADYHNLEKRIQSDGQIIAEYSKASLVKKLLPALDSLDQAVAGVSEAENSSSWLTGVMISLKQLRQALAEEGLAEIESSGQFNPELHEAIDVRVGEDNKILEVVQRGYTLNEKVLRPARVVVGKANPGTISEEAREEIGGEE
ncbi:MAG: nucleotide exchange factor GrpE [Candidatus Daviesbacteria bacterium]